MADPVVPKMSLSFEGTTNYSFHLVLFSLHHVSPLVVNYHFGANESKLLMHLQDSFDLSKNLG